MMNFSKHGSNIEAMSGLHSGPATIKTIQINPKTSEKDGLAFTCRPPATNDSWQVVGMYARKNKEGGKIQNIDGGGSGMKTWAVGKIGKCKKGRLEHESLQKKST